MTPWLEAAGAALLALTGWLAGRRVSRLASPWWILGYLLPLGLIAVMGLGRLRPEWEIVPPFSWLLAGRAEYALTGLVAAMMLATPLSRLPRAGDRRAVALLALVVVAYASVYPFVCPTFIRAHLESLSSKLDSNGVCWQQDSYCCGPASAVTLLRRHGIPADFSRLAITAHTSPATGTPPDQLGQALTDLYGVPCRFRSYASLDEVQGGSVIAVLYLGLFVDHYVAVLEVGPRTVTIGDPLEGLRIMPRAEFEGRWRRTGLVLNFAGASSGEPAEP